MILTRENIHDGASSECGWNKEQLSILGVKWPPKKGWLSKLIGRTISDADYAKFLALRGVRKKKQRAAILHPELGL